MDSNGVVRAEARDEDAAKNLREVVRGFCGAREAPGRRESPAAGDVSRSTSVETTRPSP